MLQLRLFFLWSTAIVIAFNIIPVHAGPAMLVVSDDKDHYLVSDAITYLEDAEGKLGINDVLSIHSKDKFNILDKPTPNFGFTSSAYWFYFDVKNQRSQLAEWLLQLTYSNLDNIDLYVIESSGDIQHEYLGDQLPFHDRDIKDRTFLFNIDLPPQETTSVFVRIQTTSSMQAKMHLWEQNAFTTASQNHKYALGFYYGVFMAMLLYNLFVFFSIRDKIYLYYVAHVLSFSLFVCTLNGVAYQYLWPELTGWQGRASATLMSLACFSAILFTRSLLNLRQYLPSWDRLFTGLMTYFAILFVSTLFLPYTYTSQICTFSGLMLSILLNVVGWISLREKNHLAKIYVAAWTVFLLGASIYALKTYGLLPQMFITEYAMQIGSMLDVVLLSMVLTYRIKILEDKNVDIQLKAKEELERKVEDRTRKLNETLDALSDSYAKVEKLNYTDPLTDIKNRRFFDEFYQHEMNNAIRSQGCIAVLVADIDHFKQINDEFGHAAGDKVLISISRVIQDSLPRKNDFVARYGGDEFVAVLPFTDKEGALLTARRIVDRLSELQVVCENNVITTTVSIGLSAMMPNMGTRTENLIIEADRALYEAKAMGRNRIRSYQNGNVELKDVDT